MALSDSELLAILLRTGSRDKTAVDLAREVLRLGKNNLMELGQLEIPELMKITGIGKAKAVAIAAALELGRRRQAGPIHAPAKEALRDSRAVASYLQALLGDLRHEVFGVIFLNSANKINHFEIISQGGMTGTVADPRVILKRALEEHAVSIILCHNHPSGNLRPSQADEELTQKMKEAVKYFDLRILDHLIVSTEGYFSFADHGLL